MGINQKEERLGIIKENKRGELMKIIKYNSNSDILVEFQDEHKAQVKTNYASFEKKSVKNPYYPSVFGVGKPGNKYPCKIKNEYTKEYRAWQNMLGRCFKKSYDTYDDVTCCDEWLLYDNFYEWLHSQENFDKWLNGDKWCLDKDILIKGNKIYSPDTCCLVSFDVNVLFVKRNKMRGDLPIGVHYDYTSSKIYAASCHLNNGKTKKIGRYNTPKEAFYAYKEFKENLIKKIAKEEYRQGNISKLCYEAMMNYEVEITD